MVWMTMTSARIELSVTHSGLGNWKMSVDEVGEVSRRSCGDMNEEIHLDYDCMAYLVSERLEVEELIACRSW